MGEHQAPIESGLLALMEYDLAAGRPPLVAVIVSANRGHPSAGYFKTTEALGLYGRHQSTRNYGVLLQRDVGWAH